VLFNSLQFVFVLLPVTLLVYHLFSSLGRWRLAMGWLVVASLVFYAWGDPVRVAFIALSCLFNYGTGRLIRSRREHAAFLVGGLFVNLAALGFCKYGGFTMETVNALFGASIQAGSVVAPLGISFITFQQIAYVVDTHRGTAPEGDFLEYCLYITLFPQLIAGPILRPSEMLPQVTSGRLRRLGSRDLSVGVTMFIIGLFEKAILADGIRQYATPVFTAARQGQALTFLEAWQGPLAYALQIYFDFSGYANMAIGAARMFGIRLPLNFDSPYRSESIIDFWRRWHMTLSRFLRDYLYIPLGGNRKGSGRKYLNLMITMLLGGLWHGAGWGFVIWGALHGLYLVVNHWWRSLRSRRSTPGATPVAPWQRASAILGTQLAVVVAWVFFRADSLPAALAVLRGMVGVNGIALPARVVALVPDAIVGWGLVVRSSTAWWVTLRVFTSIAALWLIAVLMPNMQELMRDYDPALDYRPARQVRWPWKPTPLWSAAMAGLFFAAVKLLPYLPESQFLYVNF
jgi:alginate O-acetyltransferase complex protein AlgI